MRLLILDAHSSWGGVHVIGVEQGFKALSLKGFSPMDSPTPGSDVTSQMDG